MERKNGETPAKDRRKDEKQEYDRPGSGTRPDRRARGASAPRKSPPHYQPDDDARWEDDGGEAG
jgi:hypothetical protein